MATTKNPVDQRYHQYPVYSQDEFSTGGGVGFEGAQKRFTTFPQPREVLDYALMGFPKIFPLTGESITPEHIQPFLDSASTELEMTMGLDITPVERDHSVDYVQGLFESNATGIKLPSWPATKVLALELRFPHTQTSSPYQSYSIPAQWVALRNNRLNVLASYGSISVEHDAQGAATAAGLFSYITGFSRGAYQPAMVSVRYVSGFEPDRLPIVLADLIKTWAALRFLTDVFAPMFPVSSVSVAIDGASQSANTPINQLLMKRIEMLEKKQQQQMNAITKAFGRTIKMAFV